MIKLRNERGSAIVEFSLIFPVFFLIVMGTISLLWVLTSRSAISGAARDGARFASIRHDPLCEIPTDPMARSCAYDWPTQTEVADFVRERAGIFDVQNVELVCPTPLDEDGLCHMVPNETVTVRVHSELPILFKPVAALFNLDAVDYVAEAKAKSE